MHEVFDTSQLSPAVEQLISRYPLLSAEEEQALARDGSAAARDELILCNLRLVKSIVLEFSGCGLDPDDLFSEGEVALIQAVDKYKPSRGRPPRTPATVSAAKSWTTSINTGRLSTCQSR